MAKTMSATVRNNMLSTISDSSYSDIGTIKLVTDDGDTLEFAFQFESINFQQGSDGVVVQGSTISDTYSHDTGGDTVTVTGYKLYTSDETDEDNYEMEGEFSSSITLDRDGTEYTINVSGIEISLPEEGN